MSGKRLLPALVLAPLLVWAAPLDVAPTYVVILSVFAAVASAELYRLLLGAGHQPAWPLGVALAVALAADAGVSGWRLAPHAITATAFLALVWTAFRVQQRDALVDWGLTLVPALYVGGLLGYYAWLRALPGGAYWVLLVLGCTWAADTAAYFGGRRWGRTKLAPALSPGKSVEGAIAGVVAALALAATVAWVGASGIVPIVGAPPFGGWTGVVGLGLLVALAGIVGDLAESFIKRQVGVKDASNLLLGHGGLLDRIDSLLAAGMLAYFYLLALRQVTG